MRNYIVAVQFITKDGSTHIAEIPIRAKNKKEAKYLAKELLKAKYNLLRFGTAKIVK